MGRKLRFALVLALVAAAGCQSINKLPPGFGTTGLWPKYQCPKDTAENLLKQIYSSAAQAAHTDPYKSLTQAEVLRVLVLPDDPVKNAQRCMKVEQAWTFANAGQWLDCFVELDQCN